MKIDHTNLAGLRHFTFHALRHTFASRALEQGMDAKTLSVILGHSSVAFTLDRYAHVLTDHKIEEMKCMQTLLMQSQAPNITVATNMDYPTSNPSMVGIQNNVR